MTVTQEAPKQKRSPRPEYGLTPVDILPENPKRNAGTAGGPPRQDHYGDMLPEVAANPGVWFKLATFYTQGGAQGALKGLTKRLEEGRIDGIPAVGGFDLQSRRTDVVAADQVEADAPAGSYEVGPIVDGEGNVLADVGTRVSKLFAMYVPDA